MTYAAVNVELGQQLVHINLKRRAVLAGAVGDFVGIAVDERLLADQLHDVDGGAEADGLVQRVVDVDDGVGVVQSLKGSDEKN